MSAPLEQASLPQLPGLDLAAALQGMAGNRDLLLRAAKAFTRDYGGLAQVVTASLAEGRFDEVGRLAHRLKGASAMLGARTLSAAAAGLEQAHKHGDTQQVAQLAAPCLAALEQALAGLAMLEPAMAAPAVAPLAHATLTEAVALLDGLIPLIRDGNFAAGARIERLATLLAGSAHAAPLAVIGAQFDDLETDSAAAHAETLRRALVNRA